MELIKADNLGLTHAQLMLFLPYFIILAGGMLTLLTGVSKSLMNTPAPRVVAFGTVLAALYSVIGIWGEPGTSLFSGMLAADYFSNLLNVVFLASTALVMLSSFSY